MKTFTKIEDYMILSREERRKHLSLEEPCIEIGSDSRSFRGLLAHYLGTTIGGGNRVHLCHGCNNGKCSNPVHLYWGTPTDNVQDAIACGRWKSMWQRTIEKYGEEKARQLHKEAARRGAINSTKNRPAHSVKPPKTRKQRDDAFTDEKRKMWELALSELDLTKIGWVSLLAKKVHLSHTQVRRVMSKYFSHVPRFERK